MALVNPNIAMSFRMPEFQVPNALAQYAQLAQIKNLQRDEQLNQLRMDELQTKIANMRQDEADLESIRQAIVKNGGPSDTLEIAKAYASSRDPQNRQLGLTMMQKIQDKAEFQRTYGPMFPGLFPATPAAPAAAPAAPTAAPAMPEPSGAIVGGPIAPPTARVTPTPLEPPGAPAPVNAMAPAGSLEAMPLNQLRATQMALGSSTDPRAKTLGGIIEKEIESRKQPEAVRSYEFAKTPAGGSFKGTFEDWKRLGAAKTEIKLPAQQTKEQEERGRMLTSQYAEISKAAGIASRTLPGIEANLSILNKGFETGFGTGAQAAAASVLGALGVADAKQFATNAQIFQSKATEAILQKQLEQKGPQTEADAKRIDQIGAQLGKTTDANRFILNVAKAQFNRDREQRAFWDKWWKTNKTYDGAEDAWYSGEGGKSLFDRPELKKYSVPSAAAQIPTDAGQIPRQTAAPAAPIYASNPTTGERIMSTDGGNTWQPAR